MILGFKKRFVPFIERGEKTHTIRKGKRWRVGMKAHLYASPRTKQMRLIYESPVTKVETIRILVGNERLSIRINDVPLADDEIEALARRDGFPQGAAEMYLWWRKTHKVTVFDGQIIHWQQPKTGK